MSTINSAKAAMAFKSKYQRDSCQNCQHVETLARIDRPVLMCIKGEFMTDAFAICGLYQPHQVVKP